MVREFVSDVLRGRWMARDVRECLMLQLKERNRFDPAMAALLDNLELLARRDMASLRKACGVRYGASVSTRSRSAETI